MENIKENVIYIYADGQINEEEMEETRELIKACDMEIVQEFTQKLHEVTFATYMGKGKAQEIAEYLLEHPVDCIIIQQLLSPLQLSNLETLWNCPIMDRSELIVEIFARRAKSKEAKLQVESARLKKLLPRLIGSHTSLGRQSGGRNKGSGEKQLEIDRRRIKGKISELDRELKKIKGKREVQRRARTRKEYYQVALVGYTNAGKSTLMNALLRQSQHTAGQEVFEQDMLFATLDTSVRKIRLRNHQEFLLSDTVGFVSQLPHELIKAFHSTLEEVAYADLLLQVIDISSANAQMQMEVTTQTLHEIHADHIPMIKVYNKADKSKYPYPQAVADGIYISAREQIGLDVLLEAIEQQLFGELEEYTFVIPYEDSHMIHELLQDIILVKQENCDTGSVITGKISKNLRNKYVNYVKL